MIRAHTPIPHPPGDGNQIETRIGRGRQVESRHVAIGVALPAEGVLRLFGTTDPGTFLRSVAKPFQTLALFRAGVIEHHALHDEEIAVISASHGGEPRHRRLVEGLLRRGGFRVPDLRCGAHAPYSSGERHRMRRNGERPDPACNNCSGKHAGMLLHAAMIGADPESYLAPEHPVQRAVQRVLETFLGLPLDDDRLGVDGCGTPTWHVPLAAIARGFQRLHDPEFLHRHGYSEAARRLHGAIASHPRTFSGEGRLPFRWSRFLSPQLYSKEGAEGVFVVWGPAGALVVKALDGGERGYAHVVPHLLEELGWLPASQLERWRRAEPLVVRNVSGLEVGRISVELPAAEEVSEDR